MLARADRQGGSGKENNNDEPATTPGWTHRTTPPNPSHILLPLDPRHPSPPATEMASLDTLLNPIPGGLYTPELGQFGDNACATCGLKNPQCPGHCGHIEMPVPCYHPTFLDQVLRLVRASCVYCYRLKMGRVAVHRFGAKLRLVECGLVQELRELDEITASSATAKDIGSLTASRVIGGAGMAPIECLVEATIS